MSKDTRAAWRESATAVKKLRAKAKSDAKRQRLKSQSDRKKELLAKAKAKAKTKAAKLETKMSAKSAAGPPTCEPAVDASTSAVLDPFTASLITDYPVYTLAAPSGTLMQQPLGAPNVRNPTTYLASIMAAMFDKMPSDVRDPLIAYLRSERIDVASFCAGTDSSRLIMEAFGDRSLCCL